MVFLIGLFVLLLKVSELFIQATDDLGVLFGFLFLCDLHFFYWALQFFPDAVAFPVALPRDVEEFIVFLLNHRLQAELQSFRFLLKALLLSSGIFCQTFAFWGFVIEHFLELPDLGFGLLFELLGADFEEGYFLLFLIAIDDEFVVIVA